MGHGRIWQRVTPQLPNMISTSRLAAVPLLWGLCIMGEYRAFGVGLLICLASDIVDGWLARRLNAATSFGAKLDSAADNAMLVSVPIWVYLVVPDIVERHFSSFVIFTGLLILTFACMAVKFGRNVEIHTYASKFGVGVMWIYLATTSLYKHYDILYFSFIITSIIFLIEDIYHLVTRDYIDEHVKTAIKFSKNK